jgi:plastocyanin
MPSPLTATAALLALLAFAQPAFADTPTASLTIRNQQFEPTEVEVPAGQKIELHVKNSDVQPAEFESGELHREKVVPGGQEVVVFIGPLRAGSYEFFNDFHPSSRGHVVAR